MIVEYIKHIDCASKFLKAYLNI